MSSISVSDSTKQEFDQMKPDDLTHDEFMQEMIEAKKRDEGEIVNVDEIVDQVANQVASTVELASFRGTREALESKLNERN